VAVAESGLAARRGFREHEWVGLVSPQWRFHVKKERAMNSRWLCSLLLVGLAQAAVAESKFLVGVLEHTPSADPGEPTRPRVRMVFHHTSAGWEALPNDCASEGCLSALTIKYPAEVVWAISHAGLALGTVVARTPSSFTAYAEIGMQNIISKGAVPAVGKPAIEYAGLTNEPRRRPLLATHGQQRPMRSSAGWKEGVPDPEDLNRVWPVFRHHVPQIHNCAPATDSGVDVAGGTAMASGRAPTKLDLEIPEAWVTRNGDALLRVVVRREQYRECDGPRVLPSQLWLLRQSNGQIRTLPGQLGSGRAELVLPLEFVDLLRDGHEEVLFMTGGYNRGGYVLYYNAFRKFVKYTWQYH
jgi:hypothetical protein